MGIPILITSSMILFISYKERNKFTMEGNSNAALKTKDSLESQ